MIYTNTHNLPDYVKSWLINDTYDYEENVISATTLLKPTRQIILEMRHRDEIVQDVSELIASKFGTALHLSFEKVNIPNVMHEKRLYCTFTVNDREYKVSGKFDMLKYLSKNTQMLIDIKTTSVWTYIKGSRDNDYVKQLSIYKYLCNKNGFNVVDKAEICYVFTDWSKSKAGKNGYPELRVQVKEIDLLSDEETETLILKKLIEIDNERLVDENNLIFCNDLELWRGPTYYLVEKDSKSVKYYNKEEALKLAESIGTDNIKEVRGKPRRCEYCNVRQFCNQYRKEVE